MTIIPKDLLKAYQTTEFRVDYLNICIRVGEHCPILDELLNDYGQDKWAYITAYNPGSKLLSTVDNKNRNNQLIECLTDYICFEGYGKGLDPKLVSEKSILVIGISKSNSIEIGEKKIGQNSIVFGRIYEPAELILLK